MANFLRSSTLLRYLSPSSLSKGSLGSQAIRGMGHVGPKYIPEQNIKPCIRLIERCRDITELRKIEIKVKKQIDCLQTAAAESLDYNPVDPVDRRDRDD